VTNGPGDSTTLILRKGPQYRLDPSALRKALARHGIPALVTVGAAMPSGTRLSIGYGPGWIKTALIKDVTPEVTGRLPG
jgi:hypothetical protein